MSEGSPVAIPAEMAAPFPPRFRWLKRMGLGLLFLVLGLLLARAGAVYRAQSTYDAEIASLRARGEPLTIEDLRKPPIPDEQNAAAYLKRAAEALTFNQQERAAMVSIDQDRATPSDRMILDGWVQNHQETIALIRQARNLQAIDWLALMRDPWGEATSIAQGQEMVVRLLSEARNLALREGHVAEFAELCRDQLTIVRVLQMAPALLPMQALRLNQLAASRIESDAPLLISRLRPVSDRHDIELLITDFLDDQRLKQCMTELFSQLRLEEIRDHALMDADPQEIFDKLLPPGSRRVDRWDRAALWFCKSTILKSDVACLKVFDQVQEQLPQSYLKAMDAIPPLSGDRTGYTIVDFRTWDDQATRRPYAHLSSYCRTVNLNHLAAVDLAIRLYQWDHHNELPHSLSDLVPTYLARIPIDPSDRDGGPVKMLRRPAAVLYAGYTDRHENFSLPVLVHLSEQPQN